MGDHTFIVYIYMANKYVGCLQKYGGGKNMDGSSEAGVGFLWTRGVTWLYLYMVWER